MILRVYLTKTGNAYQMLNRFMQVDNKMFLKIVLEKYIDSIFSMQTEHCASAN